MPKIKTHKASAKRFKVTGGGKLMRMKGQKSHLRRNRSRRAKALYSEMLPVTAGDAKRIAKLIPYGV